MASLANLQYEQSAVRDTNPGTQITNPTLALAIPPPRQFMIGALAITSSLAIPPLFRYHLGIQQQ